MKISPAPWRHGYPGGIFDASGRPVAMMYDEPGTAVRNANADLAANAPVMLELIRALLPYAPEDARPRLELFLKKFE